MHVEDQRHGRAQCLNQLGAVAYELFKEARAVRRPENELLEHIGAAARFYHEALDLLPPDAVDDLAVAHNQLGNIYGEAGELDRAVAHWHDAIRHREKQGNLYEAARARSNIAIGLANAHRLPDAREYALAALRNFETFGDRAADKIANIHDLLADIDHHLTQPS